MSEHAKELQDRLVAEAAALDAQRATCEHALHAAPIGCPYCRRDGRQSKLLHDAATFVGAQGEALTQAQAELASTLLAQSFALCDQHQPSVWEGSGSCVICEAINQRVQLEQAEAEAAALRTALEQAKATIDRMMTEADEDAASWQTQKARADKAEAANIVLQAEAEVGQQVRELVQAISRDGETVVGAVQRLIAEGEQAQATIERLKSANQRQYASLAEVREEADAATGINREGGDERPSGAIGAVRVLRKRLEQALAERDAMRVFLGDASPKSEKLWLEMQAKLKTAEHAEAEQAGLRAQVQALRDQLRAEARAEKDEEGVSGFTAGIGYAVSKLDALLSSVSLPQPVTCRLLEACRGLLNAPHPDHFASRLSDGELDALNRIKAGVAAAACEGAR